MMILQRREFSTLLGGGAAWPLAARAQQGDRVRRVGVLLGYEENDPEANRCYSAFTQALADLGWTDGRNVRIDLRWGGDDTDRTRALAQELVGLQPDIIVADGTPATAALQRETRTTPIVFASVSDPVASGPVARLDRPIGNITGFATFETTLAGKWLELLSEITPGLKRAGIMFNPDTAVLSFVPSLETAARSLKVVPIIAPVHDDGEIEAAIIHLGTAGRRPCCHAGRIHDRASRADPTGGGSKAAPAQKLGRPVGSSGKSLPPASSVLRAIKLRHFRRWAQRRALKPGELGGIMVAAAG
jgi:putative ABC transport system substrate-binding protein